MSIPTRAAGNRTFRAVLFALALLLGCLSVWILAAECLRQPPFDFYVDHPSTTVAAASQRSLASAASVGVIRGDLWAADALAYFDTISADIPRSASTQDSKTNDQLREIATRALSFGPCNAGVWLVLADSELRFDWFNHKAAAALRMSYYTGANETKLIPLRLLLAVQSIAIADNDFQLLVRHDLRIVVTGKKDMKSAIVAAYRIAAPTGRQFIEDALEEIDPPLLATLRPKG